MLASDEDPAHTSAEPLGRDLLEGPAAVIDIRGLWDRVSTLAGSYEEDAAEEERYARECAAAAAPSRPSAVTLSPRADWPR